MEKYTQFGDPEGTSTIDCSEFDALLSDALDGMLSAVSQKRFDLHKQTCPICSALFRETSAGMNWLATLEEITPPANLVHNIIAATSMQARSAVAAAPRLSWKARIVEFIRDLGVPFRGLVREPRLVMTAAMAIFSLTLSLNLAGVKLADLKHIDLRPSAIRETATMKYTETTNRVIHYYNSIRLVYEVESRLQELKRATSSDEQEQRRPADRNKTENNKDQERKQNYYSRDQEHMQLAQWSTHRVNRSIQGLYLAAMMPVDHSINHIERNFTIAELPSGLQRDKSRRSLQA